MIKAKDFIKELNLRVLNSCYGDEWDIHSAELNRPALQFVGQVNYLIKRIRAEMGCPDAKVIATGGFAKLIADESKMITCFDGLLTLKGLLAIYNNNFGGDEE